MPGAAKTKQADATAKAILFDGASVSQLGQLFGMDNRNVAKRLVGVAPCGMRAGFPVYKIREAAPKLLRVDEILTEEQIEQHLIRMNHDALPPRLTKELWHGKTARRKFEELEGDLWKTEDVRIVATRVLNSLRMRLLLLVDVVERSSDVFTEKQRRVLINQIDRAMEDLRVQLTVDLRKPNAAEQRPETGEPDDSDL